MIKAIVLERNLKLIEINKQTEIMKKIPDYKENVHLFHQNDKWTQINEEFLNSFVEMLK
jgi:hypothetical protein